MKMLKMAFALLPAVLLFMTSCANNPSGPSSTLLKNDTFNGSSAAFAAGFNTGEAAASTLGPVTGSVRIKDIKFLYGGAATAGQVGLTIYQESGTTGPGTQLFQGNFMISSPSDSALQVIDVSSSNIIITDGASFRVAITLLHSGLPALGFDSSLTSGRNFVFFPPSWYTAESYAVTGDWIIRADVTPD